MFPAVINHTIRTLYIILVSEKSLCFDLFCSDFWWMRPQLECTLTWSTKEFPSQRTKPWVCTVQYGMLMTGPHRGEGSRLTGAMHLLLHHTRALILMHASAQRRLQVPIMPKNAAAVLRKGSGGMSQHCLSSMCTKATSSCGLEPITSSMTIALTRLGSQLFPPSACTTATSHEWLWMTEGKRICVSYVKKLKKKRAGWKKIDHNMYSMLFCSCCFVHSGCRLFDIINMILDFYSSPAS